MRFICDKIFDLEQACDTECVFLLFCRKGVWILKQFAICVVRKAEDTVRGPSLLGSFLFENRSEEFDHSEDAGRLVSVSVYPYQNLLPLNFSINNFSQA